MLCEVYSFMIPRLELMLIEPADPKVTNRSLLYLDTRRSLITDLTLRSNLALLGPSWGLQLMGTRESLALHSARLAGPQWHHVVYTELEDYGLGSDAGRMLKHVDVLKTAEFWEHAVAAEHVLIAQSHTTVLRGAGSGSAEDAARWEQMLQYDLVGTPWHVGPVLEGGVGGNGGFSLRRRSTMVELGIQTGCSPDMLLDGDRCKYQMGQPLKDIFWSGKIAQSQRGRLPPHPVSMSFSTETVFHPTPLGHHATHMYTSVEQMWTLLAA